MSNLKITMVKSAIRSKPKQKATLEALGLRKIQQSTVQKDSKSLQGMIQVVSHLVQVEATS